MRLYNLRQGNQAVNKYTKDFNHLIMQCASTNMEKQMLVRYLGGLRIEIYDLVIFQPFCNYKTFISWP